MAQLKVLCWSEVTEPASVYPDGIHGAVAALLSKLRGMDVRVARLDDPDQGLAADALAWADVVVWFGHIRHGEVPDSAAEAIKRRIEDGMGFVALHSAQASKPLQHLLGGSGSLGGWREEAEPERIIFWEPDHPIADGLHNFVIPETEMYNEPFDVPAPDALVFCGLWDDGRWFRSGCCWERGDGRFFYFRPGHETYPVFYQDEVQQLLANCVEWAGRKR